MKTFNEIITNLGGGNGPWDIGDNPPLMVKLNQRTRSLIFVLNSGVHITVFENTWNNIGRIRDLDGEWINVGPYCLHLTAGNERWFRQFEDGNWEWVTDYGTPTERYILAFNAMINTMSDYIN